MSELFCWKAAEQVDDEDDHGLHGLVFPCALVFLHPPVHFGHVRSITGQANSHSNLYWYSSIFHGAHSHTLESPAS